MMKQDFLGSFMINLFALIQCRREGTSLTTVSLNISKSFPEKKQFVSSVFHTTNLQKSQGEHLFLSMQLVVN